MDFADLIAPMDERRFIEEHFDRARPGPLFAWSLAATADSALNRALVEAMMALGASVIALAQCRARFCHHPAAE